MLCANGIVNLRAVADGKSDYLTPHTPRLFALSKRAFEFDPEAGESSRWMQFLDEVWPGDADTLQFTRAFEYQTEFDLDDKLVEELPGIALWAVDGWKRLQFSKRFTDSKAGQAMTKKLEDAANPIVAFLGEECAIRSDASITKDALFEKWKSWCDENEFSVGTKNTFCSKLYSACPGVNDSRRTIKGKRVPCFSGIALRNTKAGNEQSNIRLVEFPQQAASGKTETSLAS